MRLIHGFRGFRRHSEVHCHGCSAPRLDEPVCINKARLGDKIGYEWTNGKGGFHLSGEC